MDNEVLPRRFGDYLLAAALSEDALGRVYRAIRLSPERSFVRLRILEGPEIPEDAVLDAIQENGEIHTFLKNPVIARGVQMDAVEGLPFIAWSEENGRTLDALLSQGEEPRRRVPAEHALLIAEKLATALDHAYNTTVDGERTIHGLVWPGFVSVSDDGEIRVTGFGLAAAFDSSMEKPFFSLQIAPYLAPERRSGGGVVKNSDVFSVGAILFELLTGLLPGSEDPLAGLRAAGREEGSALSPEVASLLRLSLAPAETRYATVGELRRELGKLLFSGPYSPSTFNLAFFLNNLFGAEIEAETRARLEEASLDPGAIPDKPAARVPVSAPLEPPASPASPPLVLQAPTKAASAPRRAPVSFIAGGLLVAGVFGGVYAIARKPSPPPPLPAAAAIRPTVAPPAASPEPEPDPTPSAPTSMMSDVEFQEEVSRRVARELSKIEEDLKRSSRKEPEPAPPEAAPAPGAVEPDADAGPAEAEPRPAEPPETPALEIAVETPATDPEPVPTAIAAPSPRPIESREVAASDTSLPPRIKKVIKPMYPPMALKQRIGGTVVLRVLVSETGRPLEVDVLRGARAGLSEAAAMAVRRWTFEPALKDGVPVQAWTTIPIPFEP